MRLKKPKPYAPPPGSLLVGVGEQRFIEKPDRIWLTPKLAGSHALVVGRTGSGKTKWLENVCRQYLAGEHPFTLLDLHGDLAVGLRDYAAEIGRELIWLDAANPDRTVTFNPLAAEPGHEATQILELVASFRRHWSDSWGPRLADLLTHSLSVLAANQLTLCELPLLLGSADVRMRLLEKAPPAAKDYFAYRYGPLSKRDQIMVSESTANKVGALLSDSRVRTFIGDPQPTLRPHQVMAKGETLIARIPRGALVENADLLASLLLAAFHTAALARVSLSPAKRRPYALVIDEAQIASETFPQLLSGARAFGLSAICGIQYLDQVPPNLTEALLANTRVRVVFGVARRDAERLAKEMYAVDGDHVKFMETDLFGARKSKPIYWSINEEWEYLNRFLMDQATGECVIQLGRELPWFANAIEIEPARPAPNQLAALARICRRRARDRAGLEAAIRARRQSLYDDAFNDTTQKGGDPYDDDTIYETA